MIRIAEMEDIETIIKLMKVAISQMDERFYPVEDDVLEENVRSTFHMCPFFLVCEGDYVVGLASLALATQFWSSKPYLTTSMVYVLPEYRCFDTIKQLYKAIRRYADLQGILYLDNFYGTDKIDGRARLARTQKLDVIGLSILYEGQK